MARARRLRALRADGALRPGPRARGRGGARRRRARSASRGTRARRRPRGVRRLRAGRRRRHPEGSRARDEAAIPSTYVPARNTVFLSLALAWAEVRRRRDASSSASTRSTTPAIRTAAPSTSTRSSAWPRWRRKAGVEGRPLRIARAAPAPVEGGHHPRRAWRSASTTASPTAATIRRRTAGRAAAATAAGCARAGSPKPGVADPRRLPRSTP